MRMRTTMTMAAISIAIMAAGCSKKTPAPNQDKPQGHFTITAPPAPTDPVEKHKFQEDLVEHMIEDSSMPLDMIQGEAYRRGVTLTPEQIARKKAQKPSPRP